MYCRIIMRTLLVFPLLCCLLTPLATAVSRLKPPSRPGFARTNKSSVVNVGSARKRRSSRWDCYLTRLYQEADLNHDGRISFDECYERVLLFYIKLNRQAPIPPPSRSTLLGLYSKADRNHSSSLSEEEFKDLASTLASRGATRLLAHKLVTLLVAPWLATTAVHFIATAASLQPLRRSWHHAVERSVPHRLAQATRSRSFWKTVVLIFTVSRLGNVVLEGVNWCLNRKWKAK